MSLESSILFFLAIIVFAVTPGPGVFFLLSHSLQHDAKSCLPYALGMTVSDVIYLIMAILGMAHLAENWNELFFIIRILGATYLLYLAWKLWNAPIDTLAAKTKKSKHNGFIIGFLISASNPKVILFYIAFLPTFMDLTQLLIIDIFLVSTLCFIGVLVGLMFIAFGAQGLKRKVQSHKTLGRINKFAATLMASAGIYIGVHDR